MKEDSREGHEYIVPSSMASHIWYHDVITALIKR